MDGFLTNFFTENQCSAPQRKMVKLVCMNQSPCQQIHTQFLWTASIIIQVEKHMANLLHARTPWWKLEFNKLLLVWIWNMSHEKISWRRVLDVLLVLGVRLVWQDLQKYLDLQTCFRDDRLGWPYFQKYTDFRVVWQRHQNLYSTTDSHLVIFDHGKLVFGTGIKSWE